MVLNMKKLSKVLGVHVDQQIKCNERVPTLGSSLVIALIECNLKKSKKVTSSIPLFSLSLHSHEIYP
jgi:hypothetical protein